VIWERFCDVIGRKDLVDHPAYALAADRSKNRDALNALLAEVTRAQPSAYWIDLLNEVGVPCGPINTIDQVFADPQIRHLGMAQPVRSHERGDTELVGQPIVMSRTPSRITAPPPLMGEHTEQILADLGYDDGRIAALRAAGVI
jgi:crotonobetainyl-CoA:carnitine CoA-transferase CaiB-like acyl-CoA transferase